MRIVFLGSPDFAVPTLRDLHASRHEVVCVVTQPDRPFGRHLHLHAPAVKTAALELGIPVLQPSTTRTPEFVTSVATYRPDILVVVAYGEILRPALLASAPRGAVNLHASLLPKYRGAAPVPWAILNGEKITGCSTMQISETMDAGPVYLQQTCEILPSDTSESLLARLGVQGAPLLTRTIDLLANNALEAKAQDPAQVTFAPKLKKQDGAIDWNHTSERIWLRVRAFYPWPGTFSSLRSHKVKIIGTEPAGEQSTQAPGTILRIEKDSILVACGEGTVLRILQLQPENRARLSARDFVNGVHLHPGDAFSAVPIS